MQYRFVRSCMICTNVAESAWIHCGKCRNGDKFRSAAPRFHGHSHWSDTDEGDHITMMTYDQYTSQARSSDLAQLEESNITPMILRSFVAGRSFTRLPFCANHTQWRNSTPENGRSYMECQTPKE